MERGIRRWERGGITRRSYESEGHSQGGLRQIPMGPTLTDDQGRAVPLASPILAASYAKLVGFFASAASPVFRGWHEVGHCEIVERVLSFCYIQ